MTIEWKMLMEERESRVWKENVNGAERQRNREMKEEEKNKIKQSNKLEKDKTKHRKRTVKK